LILITSRKLKGLNLFCTGLLSGLLVNIRIGDAILLIPIIYLIKDSGHKLIYFVLGFSITIFPQLINQVWQYQGLLDNPYVNGQNGNWSIGFRQALETLFSVKRGFFTWTPIFIFATFGLIKKKKYFILATLTIFWLMSSFWSGGLSAGFGLRLMFSSIPYFAEGIAHIYENTNFRNIWRLFIFSSVYNVLLLYGFYVLKWKNLP
jgi:hypothetical protein